MKLTVKCEVSPDMQGDQHNESVTLEADSIEALQDTLKERGWRNPEGVWLCSACAHRQGVKDLTDVLFSLREKEVMQDSLALGIDTELPLADQLSQQDEMFRSQP